MSEDTKTAVRQQAAKWAGYISAASFLAILGLVGKFLFDISRNYILRDVYIANEEKRDAQIVGMQSSLTQQIAHLKESVDQQYSVQRAATERIERKVDDQNINERLSRVEALQQQMNEQLRDWRKEK